MQNNLEQNVDNVSVKEIDWGWGQTEKIYFLRCSDRKWGPEHELPSFVSSSDPTEPVVWNLALQDVSLSLEG